MAAVHDEAMQRVKDLIDADPSQSHTLPEMARVAQFGLFHFQRLFQARYRITAGWYVRKARMRLACHLIETTDWDMARITHEIGYQSQPGFSHVFTRIVGVPPTAYRRWAAYAAELGTPSQEG